MARIVQRTSPGMRLQLGASALTAARAVDTRLVEARIANFDRVHQSYVGAQREVDVASRLRAAQVRVAESDAILDEAVETLARALVADGEPRANPFEAFGAPAPGTVKELLFAEEAATVHQLAAAVQRSKGASAPTIDAARAADEARGPSRRRWVGSRPSRTPCATRAACGTRSARAGNRPSPR